VHRLLVISLFLAAPLSAQLSFDDPVLCANQTSEWWALTPTGQIGPRNELYAAWTHTGFGSQDGGIYFARSLDTNRTWSSDITIHYWDPTWIHAVYQSPVLQEYQDTLYCLYWLKPEGSEDKHLYASRSDDQGASWNIFESSISGGVSGSPDGVSLVALPGRIVHLVFASRIGMARPRSYHCRSTNGGLTFTSPAPLPGDPATTGVSRPSLVVAPGGELLVVNGHTSQAGSWLVLNRSTDNGATWDTAHLRGRLGDGSSPSLYHGGPGRLYLLWQASPGTAIRFSRSDDLGRTWSSPLTLQNATWSYCFAASDDRVLAIWWDPDLWEGFYRYSTDGGEAWSPSSRIWATNPFPGDWLGFRAEVRNDLAAFWMHPEPGSVEGTYCSRTDWPTGVAETGPARERPGQTLAATPSPFRSSTTFRLPEGHRSAPVLVHDAAGRLVRRLDPAAGLTWDGADRHGRRLPPGVYLARAGELPSARVVLSE